MTRARRALSLTCLLALLGTGSAHAAESRGRIAVDGLQRTYRLYVPPSADAGARLGLVVALHPGGRSESGARMAAATRLDRQADRHRFAIVYPDAVSGHFDAGRCCGTRRVADLTFVDRLVARLRRTLPVDPRRISATGFSNGGFLAYRLACHRARTFAAIAVVATTEITHPCRPARPVSVLHVHGGRDRRLGPRGGFLDSPSIRGVAHRWRRRDGCRAHRAARAPRLHRDRWTRCRGGARVRLDVLPAAPHGWPGALGPYGHAGDTYDASAEVGAFLAAARRR